MFRAPEKVRKAVSYGTTPLVAAMRCYVESVFDEVDVPEELV